LTATSCPKAFSFTLSWSLPLFLSIIFHSTRRQPKTKGDFLWFYWGMKNVCKPLTYILLETHIISRYYFKVLLC
jgi:hypothetical protein